MRRSHVLCIAALLATSGVLPAIGQEVQTRQRVVTYGDLNLDSSHGARTMVRRIENASRQVCGDRSGPRGLAENGSVHACRGVSAENAISDLDAPMVTAQYYGTRGGSVVITDDSAPVYDDSAAPVIEPTSPYDDNNKGY